MIDPPKDKLEPLRLLAAKQVLGLADSSEFPPICDAMLIDGVYSPSLMELAEMSGSNMWEIGPMLAKTLRELEIHYPAPTDALMLLATQLAIRLAGDNASFGDIESSLELKDSEFFYDAVWVRKLPLSTRPFDFIWRCYGAYDDVTDFDPEYQPLELSNEAARWEYLRPIMQRAAKNWLDGKPLDD